MPRMYALTFLAALFMLTFTSCEQQLADQMHNSSQALGKTGAAYLDTHFTPPVMFQYVQFDETTNIYSGWVIDNKGKVKSYSLDHDALRVNSIDRVNKTSMDALLQNLQTVQTEIDLEELVEQYQLTIKASDGELDTKNIDESATITSSL